MPKGGYGTTLPSFITFEDNQNPVPAEIPADGPPPGRAVAEALAQALQNSGLHVAHPVDEWESYGWEFTVASFGRKVWCMLQASDHWLLITDVHRSWIEKIRGKQFPDAHRAVLDALREVLTSGMRWRDVGWHTREDFERGGRPQP